MNTLLALVFLLGPAPEPTSTPREVYRKVDHIDFEKGGEFDVAPRRPYGAVFVPRKPSEFEAMVPERQHFKNELVKSLETLEDSKP